MLPYYFQSLQRRLNHQTVMERKLFETVEDTEKFISDYYKQWHQPVRLESYTSVGQFNKKTKKETSDTVAGHTHVHVFFLCFLTRSIIEICKDFVAQYNSLE